MENTEENGPSLGEALDFFCENFSQDGDIVEPRVKRKRNIEEPRVKRKRHGVPLDVKNEIWALTRGDKHRNVDIVNMYRHIAGVNKDLVSKQRNQRLPPQEKRGNPKYMKERDACFQAFRGSQSAMTKENFCSALREGNIEPGDKWIGKSLEKLERMKYVKDVIITQRREKWKQDESCICVRKNFNDVDFSSSPCRRKFEELCVDMFVRYTEKPEEAATGFELLRQKVECIQLSTMELSKTRGSGGHFRYLRTRRERGEGAEEGTAQVKLVEFATIVTDPQEADEFDCCINLNEGRGKPFCGLCWRYKGSRSDTSCRHIESTTDFTSGDMVGKYKAQRLKTGHQIMLALVKNYNESTKFVFHKILIPAIANSIYTLVNARLTLGTAVKQLQSVCSANERLSNLFTTVHAHLQNLLSTPITPRLDERMYTAVQDGKLDLYIRNVFLKGIILWGNSSHMELFASQEPYFVDSINDFIYDTTDEEETPLLEAIALRNENIVKWLLSHGADITITEKYTTFDALVCADRTKCDAIIQAVRGRENS